MTQGRSVKLNVNFASLKIEASKMHGLLGLCKQLVSEDKAHDEATSIIREYTLVNNGQINEIADSSSTQYCIGREVVVTRKDDKFNYQVINNDTF